MEYKFCNWIDTLAGDNAHTKAGLHVLKSKFRWARTHEEAEEHEETPGEDGPREASSPSQQHDVVQGMPVTLPGNTQEEELRDAGSQRTTPPTDLFVIHAAERAAKRGTLRVSPVFRDPALRPLRFQTRALGIREL